MTHDEAMVRTGHALLWEGRPIIFMHRCWRRLGRRVPTLIYPGWTPLVAGTFAETIRDYSRALLQLHCTGCGRIHHYERPLRRTTTRGVLHG